MDTVDTVETSWRRRVQRWRAAIAVALVALAGPLSGTTATAATDSPLTWGVRPADGEQGAGRANFAYELDPGEVVRDAIVVTNRGAAQLTLRVYAADGYTTSSGQLDLLPADEPSTDLGTWLTLDAPEVTLGPGESSEVGFTLAVPADARPGDHSGGVVTSFASRQPGQTVTVDNRLGSRMHVRVRGDLVSAAALSDVSVDYRDTWNPFAASTAVVSYTVTNTGNTRVASTGTASVSGPFGWAATDAASDEAVELLPGESLTREVVVSGVWPLVRARAAVDLAAAGVGIGGAPAAVETAEATAWAVPWALLVAVVLVVAVAVWGPALAGRRRRPAAAAAPEPAVAPEGLGG